MRIYAPSYYTEFKCIASKCKNSCCVGWEIDIDPDTAGKYSALDGRYGESIRLSISRDDAPHFILTDKERCPHLDSSGLCGIINELGEDYLCDICREHPRFYNDTTRGREVGLGMSCEEACRIILASDGYDEFITLGECDEDIEPTFIDPLVQRAEIFAILKSKIPYRERLEELCGRFGISLSRHTTRYWRKIIESLEYLTPAHKELFSCFVESLYTPPHLEVALERMLAYLIYRHVSVAESQGGIRCALGFSLFCERLLCSVMKRNKSITVEEAARIISEELEYSEDNTDTVKMEFLF